MAVGWQAHHTADERQKPTASFPYQGVHLACSIKMGTGLYYVPLCPIKTVP